MRAWTWIHSHLVVTLLGVGVIVIAGTGVVLVTGGSQQATLAPGYLSVTPVSAVELQVVQHDSHISGSLSALIPISTGDASSFRYASGFSILDDHGQPIPNNYDNKNGCNGPTACIVSLNLPMVGTISGNRVSLTFENTVVLTGPIHSTTIAELRGADLVWPTGSSLTPSSPNGLQFSDATGGTLRMSPASNANLASAQSSFYHHFPAIVQAFDLAHYAALVDPKACPNISADPGQSWSGCSPYIDAHPGSIDWDGLAIDLGNLNDYTNTYVSDSSDFTAECLSSSFDESNVQEAESTLQRDMNEAGTIVVAASNALKNAEGGPNAKFVGEQTNATQLLRSSIKSAAAQMNSVVDQANPTLAKASAVNAVLRSNACVQLFQELIKELSTELWRAIVTAVI
jgi:hypothetical protein